MKKRIRELAEQARKALAADAMSGGEFNMKAYEHKFAELIVRECINKIETYRIPVGNSAVGEMACEWTYDALKEIRDEIKQHFGVE